MTITIPDGAPISLRRLNEVLVDAGYRLTGGRLRDGEVHFSVVPLDDEQRQREQMTAPQSNYE